MTACPYCATPGAYWGLSVVECSNAACKAFVPRESQSRSAYQMYVSSNPETLVSEWNTCAACGFRDTRRNKALNHHWIHKSPLFKDACVDPRCSLFNWESTRRWIDYRCRDVSHRVLNGNQTVDDGVWPDPFQKTLAVPCAIKVSVPGYLFYWEFDFNTFTCTYHQNGSPP